MIRISPVRGLQTLIGCICLLLSGIVPAQAQSPKEHWRVVRDSSDPTTGTTGIRATDDGHLIAVATLYKPDGARGISVSKLRAADGSTVWRSELVLSKLPAVASVRDFAVDGAGNAYVIANHSKGSVIAKFLSTGKLGWKKSVKGTPRAIAIDSQGNPAIFHMGGKSLKSGFSSHVAKYSSAKGAILWKVMVASPVPGSSAPDVQDLEFDAAGNLIVAMGGVDNIPSRCVKLEAAKGRLAWQRQFNASNGDELGIGQIAVDPDGNVVVTASRPVDAFYQRSLVTLLTAADGVDVWSNEQYTTASLLHVGFDSAGRLDRVYRTSNISNAQLVISKSDRDTGIPFWSVQNPGAQPPSYSLVSVDSGPNGEIALLTNAGTEAWVHLLDSTGKLVWAGANRPQDLSLSVDVSYLTPLMNAKQIVVLEDGVAIACARTNFPKRQQDFAKYGVPVPGKLVVRTNTGAQWVNGDSYHLGDVQLPIYSYFPVILQNSGAGDLVLSNFRIYDTRIIDAYSGYEFQIEGNGASQVLPPGGELQLQIRFRPKSAGLCTARLELNTSDPDQTFLAIPLSGTGTTSQAIQLASSTILDPQQEFQDWAVQHGMAEAVSPDDEPHGDGVPLLLKFAFNLDPSRPGRQIMERDSGLTGLPLITFEKKPGSEETWFRVEYLKRRNTQINYQVIRSRALEGPYESVTLSELNVTPIDSDWERVVGWCQRSTGNPEREFVRIEVTF